MTAPANIRAGSRILAADTEGIAPLAANKTTDQGLTSNTTLQADNALLLSLEANATYHFRLTLFYKGGTQGSSDLKFQWAFPSGTTMTFLVNGLNTSGASTAGSYQTQASTVTLGTNGTGSPRSATVEGTVTTSTTPGQLVLDWAQNTSSGTTTTVMAGSDLLAWQTG